MILISDIRTQNASFAAQKHTNDVCVFVGATSGIGEQTLDVMVSLLVAPTIYVVGRSASRWETQHQRLRAFNKQAKYIFVEVEVSTINGVDEACKEIMATESRVDYLCMSMGYLPLVGAIETSEGLEQCFTLSYWARIRFIYNLLPLLRSSPRPCVLSILAGGHEGKLNEEDMGLETDWSVPNFASQTTTMMTLALHRFASQDPNFTLIHAWPGFVQTDNPRKPKPDASASLLWRATFTALKGVMSVVATSRGISVEDSGQRHAFLLTTRHIGPGVSRFNQLSERCPRNEQLEKYLEEGKMEKVWDVTVATWNKALERGNKETNPSSSIV